MVKLIDPTADYLKKVYELANGCKSSIGRALVLAGGMCGRFPDTSEEADRMGDDIIIGIINNG